MRGQGAHGLGGIQNGPVAGAAAQIAREFFTGQSARDGLTLGGVVLVHAKQTHHKARRAKAALAAVALHQGFLGGVQGAVGCGQVFGGPQCQAVDRMRQADATVHSLVVHLTVHHFAQHHGAGAAVALVAAFFGAGAVQVFAQHLQQGAGGGDVV